MILIAGVIVGASVCAFGMWAFLKGQGTMLDITSGAKPMLFDKTAPRKNGRDDLSNQVRELFKEQST